MTYQLNIEIPSDGLQTLSAANQYITIVKSMPNGAQVAWVSFRPMLTNFVTWDEVYSVYASTTNIQDGATIVTQSTRVASLGRVYTLAGGQFDNGQPGVPVQSFGVVNEDSALCTGNVPMVTCGLYQGAKVNGNVVAGAINAIAVPFMNEAVFTPIEKIQIFASNLQDNGIVISSVTSAALEVDLTENKAQVLLYNPAVNTFTLG